MIPGECRVQSDSPKANNEGTTSKPAAGFTTPPPAGRKLYQNVAAYADVAWIIVKALCLLYSVITEGNSLMLYNTIQ